MYHSEVSDNSYSIMPQIVGNDHGTCFSPPKWLSSGNDLHKRLWKHDFLNRLSKVFQIFDMLFGDKQFKSKKCCQLSEQSYLKWILSLLHNKQVVVIFTWDWEMKFVKILPYCQTFLASECLNCNLNVTFLNVKVYTPFPMMLLFCK